MATKTTAPASLAICAGLLLACSVDARVKPPFDSEGNPTLSVSSFFAAHPSVTASDETIDLLQRAVDRANSFCTSCRIAVTPAITATPDVDPSDVPELMMGPISFCWARCLEQEIYSACEQSGVSVYDIDLNRSKFMASINRGEETPLLSVDNPDTHSDDLLRDLLSQIMEGSGGDPFGVGEDNDQDD